VKREYPDHPIIGVGAIIIRGEEVLLARRGKGPAYGNWSIPGGAVELGEKLEEAVIREVCEEVNLVIRVGEMVEVLERIFRDPEGRVQYHYVLKPSSDALEVKWVHLSNISRYRLPERTKRIIQKAFEMKYRGTGNAK